MPQAAVNSGRRFGLFVALTLGVVAVMSFAALVWPGFLRDGRLSAAALANQAETRNLLAFVPANSTAVAGIRIGQVRKQPELQSAWNKLRQQLARFQNVPAVAHELIADGDMVLLSGSGGADKTPVCIVSTEHPLDPAGIRKAVSAGAGQPHHGITVWPCEAIPGKTVSLAFPTDRIAILGFMPAESLAKNVATADQPRLHADLKAQIDQISGSVFWGAVLFDDETKQGLRKLEAMVAPYALFIPEIKTIAPLAQRGKGAVVTLDLAESQKVKLSVGFTCDNADDAAQLRTAVLNLWINQSKKLVGIAGFLGGDKLGKLLGEVSETFDLEQRDSSVLLSVQVNQATLEELLSAAPAFDFAGKGPKE